MAKKNHSSEVPGQERDDALFEALGKNKKRKRRRIILTVVSILLVLAIVAVVGVTVLQKRVREQFATSAGEVLSYEAATGSISTVVSGSGSLTDVDLTSVAVPEGVEITGISVKTNQAVQVGDILATVDMASVISTMADLQAEIEDLDEQISETEDDEVSDLIYAGVSGRVKMIYAEAEEAVTDVMYENGALALISLDGYMAVDIETDALNSGDSVTVLRAEGEAISGIVEKVFDGVATVLVTDNGPAFDETVTIQNSEGLELGGGNLYIHSALRVTGYAGTISKVRVELNEKVSDTTKLFSLENTGYSANYQSLLRSRGEKEEILLQLLSIQRDGAVLAEVPGSVYSVDYTEGGTGVATISGDEKMSVTISVDESDILSLALGQQVSVTVSSVSEDVFEGTLTEINRTSSSSCVYSAVVELEKVEGMLSGMTASAIVMIEGVGNAILIPIEAVHKTSNGAYVYTSYNEEYQEYGGKVDVVTGLENSTYVEIKSGLSVGDTVYYTESQSSFGGFGNMPGGSGGQMPDFGGQMPNMGGGSGGGMPSFGGGSGGGFPGGFGG